jgi:GNAT superfamily N-acetyltransferase
MSVTFRLARRDELQRLQDLIVVSINDLTERHGFGAMASVRPALFQLFSFDDDPRGLWVAEEESEIVGSAFSWVCGDLWFLAELFVHPARQRGGVGRELLRRTLRHAEQANAKTHALITFTFNTVSQGLYIRNGLFPRLPIYMFSADCKMLRGSDANRPFNVSRLALSDTDMSAAAAFDIQTLGVSREKHHRYLLNDPTMQGYMFHKDGQPVGYAYVASSGHVGPLAVASPDAMRPVFDAALEIAAQAQPAQVSAFLPGNCEAALGVASERGMRITLPMVLVSDRDFGDWRCYLPRNPGFM